MDLNQYAKEVHSLAVEKGWWNESEERNFGECIALVHSELSEALEEWRDARPSVYMDGAKPEGWAVELVDSLIRTLDLLASGGIDIESVYQLKHNYNRSRPYRHGGKRA